MPFVVEDPLFPWQRPTAPLDAKLRKKEENVAASQSHEKPSWQTRQFNHGQ